ncbi:uncharacterized protein LOC116850128 isoform X2 [Odontomachus brunneus]|uniref:uncharacterized protein LOC116850128 isoform X2 n=1 Tax=Odontomachus brunneus TaxID=486640 RepID=UPI0013F28578|nr:uncharacterized protein LOC116850128 isoform X2 [Odontomachus brunneus]
MAAEGCVLCKQRRNYAQGISFHVFPTDMERRKKWLNAIGKSGKGIPAQSCLCSRHFSQNCYTGSILKDDAIPTLDPESADSTLDAGTEKDQSQQPEKQSCPQIARPIIRRPRIRMLSDEEIQEMQPMKYVRYLKSVNWDEISKVPAEAKIAWEVAMEELKEGNDKIKHLQAHVCQLKTTVRKLEAALKARTKRAAVAAIAARHRKSLD